MELQLLDSRLLRRELPLQFVVNRLARAHLEIINVRGVRNALFHYEMEFMQSIILKTEKLLPKFTDSLLRPRLEIPAHGHETGLREGPLHGALRVAKLADLRLQKLLALAQRLYLPLLVLNLLVLRVQLALQHLLVRAGRGRKRGEHFLVLLRQRIVLLRQLSNAFFQLALHLLLVQDDLSLLIYLRAQRYDLPLLPLDGSVIFVR